MFRRNLLVLALASFLSVAAAAAKAPPAKAAKASSTWRANVTYLFPITRWGPSNQKSDLRAVMALAKQLKCGVVLTGVRQHYLDTEHLLESSWLVSDRYGELHLPKRTPPPKPPAAAVADARDAPHCFHDHYMPYERVLDPAAVRQWVPAATVSELRAQGWDGQLDAVMYHEGAGVWEASQHYFDENLRPENVTLARNAAHIVTRAKLRCESQRTRDLSAKARKYRVVGVHKVFLGWHDWLTAPRFHELPPSAKAPPPKDACGLAMHKADRHMLRASAWVAGLADSFVTKHLRGRPYLAIHVRPYPDSCLDEWRHFKVPASVKASPGKPQPLKGCRQQHLDFLHLKIGRCAVSQMKRRNLTQVFVMTHPAVRHVVASLLRQGGLSQDSIVFMDSHHLAEQAGCQDTTATFLSLVEEQVAVQATAFVGTAVSTMTQVVALERMGRGNHDNAYWEAVQKMC